MSQPVRVTVWNEYRHEKSNDRVKELYPDGMHAVIAGNLRRSPDLQVRTATLDEPEHGLSESVLAATDVIIWWGHCAHREVSDEVVQRVHKRVLEGMGIVTLHSGHMSKIFRRLMGTGCDLKWRAEPGEREILWVTQPGHPILEGIHDHFVIEQEEMYGEFFDIPHPECVFLISTFAGGECIRSGCTWTRGAGKVVYFRPGHETYPTYRDANVLRVIENAVRWAAPARQETQTYGYRKSGWLDEAKA